MIFIQSIEASESRNLVLPHRSIDLFYNDRVIVKNQCKKPLQATLGHPFFFRLLSNAISDFGSVGRKRKKNKNKNIIGKGVCIISVEPGNNKVWLQSQHGGNGRRKNRRRTETRTEKSCIVCLRLSDNCLK